MLAQGNSAPDFSLTDADGTHYSLSDFRGKKILLYFYPKDMTPGCTIEACSFRDDFQAYTDKNTIIIGISADDGDSHMKFRDRYRLPFILLSDPVYEVSKMYGVYREKSFLGRKFMGISRTTFLIDETGAIGKIYEKVDVKKHSKEILSGL